MKKLTVAVSLVFAMLAAGAPVPVQAQEKAEIRFSRDNIQEERKAIIKTNVQLTPEQATKFWPLYEKYRAEHRVIDDKRVKLIQDFVAGFQAMDDAAAEKIIQSFFDFKEDKLKLQVAYIERFEEILPVKTVARYYQVEHLIDTRLDYELFREFPLIK